MAPGPLRAEPTPSELVIYAYDSFVAPGGLGSQIFPIFERRCGCRVKAVPVGDGGQLLTRLELDAHRGRSIAQLVVGLDEPTWERARPWLESGAAPPEGYAKLKRELQVGGGFVPFDYGALAFVADRQGLARRKLTAPHSVRDLLKSEWKRNLILEDPRTSTPGMSFLLYIDHVYRSPGGAPWSSFRAQWLTLAPGWDAAYGLFLKGEAPLVWSYVSSQAYHEEHGDAAGPARRYEALIFDEGQPVQIEGAALIKNPRGASGPARAWAERFLAFLISPAVQAVIPRSNWMYPARVGAPLPPSFLHLPQPKKLIRLPTDAAETERALKAWEQAVERAS